TLNLNLAFKPDFAGVQTKNVYGYAQTTGGLSAGWSKLGTWTVPVAGNQPLQTVSVTPSSGSGSDGTLTFVFAGGSGGPDLAAVQVLFNVALSGVAACYIQVDPAHGSAWLANDGLTAWLGAITLGNSGSLQNSQCTVNGAGSNGTLSGNNYTLNINLGVKGPFAGTKNVYGYAQTIGGI